MPLEPAESKAAFVICYPKDFTANRMEGATISPETWGRLENEWKPGGCVVSVHDSAQADSWLDAHYDSGCVKRIRSRGYGGPLASRLSLQTQALTVFGELSLELTRLAKHLAKISGFPVVIRPRMDDPITRFRETSSNPVIVDPDNQSGHAPMSCTETSAGQNCQNQKGDENIGQSTSEVSQDEDDQTEGRGGSVKPQPSDLEVSHTSDVTLGIAVGGQESDILEVITTVKFYPEPNQNWQPPGLDSCSHIYEPSLKALISLETRSGSSVLIDFAAGLAGFLAHNKFYLLREELVPLLHNEPEPLCRWTTTYKFGTMWGWDWERRRLASRPISSHETQLDIVEDSALVPRWVVRYEFRGAEGWQNEQSSYYAVHTNIYRWPLREHPDHKRDIDIQYAVTCRLYSGNRKVKTSFIYAHQIQVWVSTESKSRVRGMTVLLAHSIPDISTRKSPIIRENRNVRLSRGMMLNPQPPYQSISAALGSFSVKLTLLANTTAHDAIIDRMTWSKRKPLTTRRVFKCWNHTDRWWDDSIWHLWPQWILQLDRPTDTSDAVWRLDWQGYLGERGHDEHVWDNNDEGKGDPKVA